VHRLGWRHCNIACAEISSSFEKCVIAPQSQRTRRPKFGKDNNRNGSDYGYLMYRPKRSAAAAASVFTPAAKRLGVVLQDPMRLSLRCSKGAFADFGTLARAVELQRRRRRRRRLHSSRNDDRPAPRLSREKRVLFVMVSRVAFAPLSRARQSLLVVCFYQRPCNLQQDVQQERN
jgi:hypothetical protein